MKPTPADWPRLSAAVFYENASAAIDWLSKAFGFEVRLKIEGANGRIEHSELTFGEGLIMVGDVSAIKARRNSNEGSPRSHGGLNTVNLCICVDDADAHCARARQAGAKILDEPSTSDYGDEYASDRTYRAEDPEGHRWWFMQRMRDPKPRTTR
jgi:uncharacterized glyoxalase superfamily protein PhnB